MCFHKLSLLLGYRAIEASPLKNKDFSCYYILLCCRMLFKSKINMTDELAQIRCDY